MVACDDLDNYDKNGRSGKKKPLTLADAEWVHFSFLCGLCIILNYIFVLCFVSYFYSTCSGNEIRCTLWGAYAQQFQDFVDGCPNRGKIMLILQFGMMKIWDGILLNLFYMCYFPISYNPGMLIKYYHWIGKMGVQNAYNGTRLFLFNGNENIPKEEFMDVEFYRLRYA